MNVKTKYLYNFGNGEAEGRKEMKPFLGGKGANLAEMSSIGLPVPPGFTISAEVCKFYNENKFSWPADMESGIRTEVALIESRLNVGFGNPDKPLLVSVRSGAAISMPGMMDTVLNLGLNDEVVAGMAKQTGNNRLAQDSYRRFIDMFGDVVMGVHHHHFEQAISALKAERGVESDTDLTAEDLQVLVERYKVIYRKFTGQKFPSDPWEQLNLAINAVFDSWNSTRALKFRTINKIDDLLGTAVTVQAMVFGNTGNNSGTGVCFTRNPSTGEKVLYGEYLLNAQGEDVVGGIRTPNQIGTLQEDMPEAFEQLVQITSVLEEHYQNMQDIEFTIQDRKLFMLQTRNGKRTGQAAVKIATDMVAEGLVDARAAVQNLVTPGHLDQLLHPRFGDIGAYQSDVIAKGLPASPGAAVGQIIFSSDLAEEKASAGEKVLLVRIETSPEDVGGMHASEGILTARGGMTSHAAVVARGWGKPCVAGCKAINISYENNTVEIDGTVYSQGDWLSINGSTGEVIKGQQKLEAPNLSGDFDTFMTWVDNFRSRNVRTNADSPKDAAQARTFGAEGIGLCRTEHMFFGEDRILAMREMILADTNAGRRIALDKLLPFQKSDFNGIFKAMDCCPVTVRLLDPPLHEFLPHEEHEQKALAAALNISLADVKKKLDNLYEFNPMLGHRGCRLGVTRPEITEMQTRAIIEAALEVKAEGFTPIPEIMIPLIGTVAEFTNQKAIIEATAKQVFAEKGDEIAFLIGTMIEIPRAALLAGQIAKEADFFSFGTNDLTQMTFGYSRDDAGTFLPHYVERKMLQEDPFQVLDQEGVGILVRMATENGRAAKPSLKVGVCGEHGGEPKSVAFFYETGLDYVSCSPFRVPIARLALAQAELANEVELVKAA